MGRASRFRSVVPAVACVWLFAATGRAQWVDERDPARSPPVSVEVQPRVERAFETQERVHVFLMLRDAEASIAQRQQRVIDALGPYFSVAHRYRNIPALAGELSREGLPVVKQQAAIAALQLDGEGHGGLAEALTATGVDMVQSMRGLTGKGVTVAVLDSGASNQHPALQGAITAQHCFTRGGCPPGNTSEGESAEDDHNHGSNVTGIVGSRGSSNVPKGYAPGSSLVPVKVLNRNNAGQVSDWVAGFDWVFENLSTLKVKVINASLVSTAEYATAAECDANESALAAIAKRLIDAGVTIAACSGNTGHTNTMPAPACNTGVIAVGATYDASLGTQPEQGGTYQALGGPNWPACSDSNTNTKTIACFTSTAGARLDLLAPGTQIASVGKGTTRSLFRGTSQASPGVAGLAALMLECNPMLTPSQIASTLKMTGEPVMDPRTGMSYPLIRGLQAIDAVCGSTPSGAGGTGSIAGMGGSTAGAAGMTPPGAAGGPAAVGGRGAAVGGSGAAGMPSSAAGATGMAAGGAAALPPTSAGSKAPATAGAIAAGGGGTLASSSQAGAAATAGAIGPIASGPIASDDEGCNCSAPGARSAGPASWVFFGGLAVCWFARRRRQFR